MISKVPSRHYLLSVSVAAFLLGTPLLQAQNASVGAISGDVTDSTGATVAGVTVTITLLAKHSERAVQTGSDGQFDFSELPKGQYRVRTTVPGFAPSTAEVLYTGSPVRLALHLTPEGSHSEVDVTADAETIDATAPARVEIPLEEISRLPSQSVSSRSVRSSLIPPLACPPTPTALSIRWAIMRRLPS